MAFIKRFIITQSVFLSIFPCAIIGTMNARGIVFPPASVLQFAIGLAVPAQVPNRTVATNLGILSNIPLPSTVKDLYPYIKNKRSILTHSYFYTLLEEIFNSHNFMGRDCVLKTICQMSKVNVNKDDITQEILEYLFVPSTVENIEVEQRYLEAEQAAKTGKEKCNKVYSKCYYSVLDLISEESLHIL